MRKILIIPISCFIVCYITISYSFSLNDPLHNEQIYRDYNKFEALGLFCGWYDYPLSKKELDQNPSFKLSPHYPLRIELGRGSGLDGLDTIKIEKTTEAIEVILHRRKKEMKSDGEKSYWDPYWERAIFLLSNAELNNIINTINALKIMELDKSYHADVYDGIQWVLWIKQEKNKKSVYCNNYFPKSIIDFSYYLNNLLLQNIDKIKWERIQEKRKHEAELWQSIR